MTIRSFVLLFCFLASFSVSASSAVWTIAIDPGHGGKDPGVRGICIQDGKECSLLEKDVVLHIAQKTAAVLALAIARELKALLDKDPNFRGVLTRQGDYYISVPERSEIARKYKANYLISIHADSSLSPELRGASVWILSNRRANDEMGQWLEDHEKRSELLGGAGNVLASHNEKYLDQTVLDLQFGHSQRVGYELGNIVLRHFSQIASLSRPTPRHASLGVLRSPDIPSILVETGFLSNQEEELKLSTPAYRKKIAQVIYNGLVEYRRKSYKDEPKIATTKTDEKSTALETNDSALRHTVKSGESLTKLATKYGVKAVDILALNKLKRKELRIGETIKIPSNGKNNVKESVEEKESQTQVSQEKNQEIKSGDIKDSGIRHTVKRGESLGKLALKYKVSSADILALNKLKRKELLVGETLKIPGDAKIEEAKPTQSLKTEKTPKTNTKETKPVETKAADNSKKQEKSNNSSTKPKEQSKSKVEIKEAIPKFHTVQKNETLYSIAREYKVSPNKLLKLNPKLKDGKVLSGQKIQLLDDNPGKK